MVDWYISWCIPPHLFLSLSSMSTFRFPLLFLSLLSPFWLIRISHTVHHDIVQLLHSFSVFCSNQAWIYILSRFYSKHYYTISAFFWFTSCSYNFLNTIADVFSHGTFGFSYSHYFLIFSLKSALLILSDLCFSIASFAFTNGVLYSFKVSFPSY